MDIEKTPWQEMVISQAIQLFLKRGISFEIVADGCLYIKFGKETLSVIFCDDSIFAKTVYKSRASSGYLERIFNISTPTFLEDLLVFLADWPYNV